MPRKKINLRDKLREYKFEFDLLQKIPCSKQENKAYEMHLKKGGKLPENVFAYVYDNDEVSATEFYTIYEPDLSQTEIAEYLAYKKLSFIKTIKNCVVFFTVLTILGMLAWFFILMNA